MQLEKAKVRDLTQRLFGKKTEKGICKSDQGEDCQPESKQKKRARGQQKGQKGHGRTSRPDLHVVEETIELNETCCAQCGKDFSPFPGEETSEIYEIEVHAFKRRMRR